MSSTFPDVILTRDVTGLPINRLSGPGGMTGPETAGPVNRPITQ